MKLLLMAGSMRRDSVNKKLVVLTEKLLREMKIDTDVKQFEDYRHELYHGDVEIEKGLPAPLLQFITEMNKVDGLVFSIPEYNYSMAGTFKNFFDWISRAKPMPWSNKKVLLLSASPALPGGIRGLWQIRVPFEGCGAYVFPDMFALGDAYNAFDTAGGLTDKILQERLKTLLAKFVDFAQKL